MPGYDVILYTTVSTDIFLFYFFHWTEVRGAASNSAYYGYPELWDSKVSCSQIPRRALAGIRTHDPLVESPTS
jgi:hypothetical protein